MNPITAHRHVSMSTVELISQFEIAVGCSTNHRSVIEIRPEKGVTCECRGSHPGSAEWLYPSDGSPTEPDRGRSSRRGAGSSGHSLYPGCGHYRSSGRGKVDDDRGAGRRLP